MQNAPDVILVVPDPGPLCNELAHPARRPQPGHKAKRFGTTLERALDRTQLDYAELGRPASVSSLTQAAHTGLRQLARPAAD